jgi:hypothetical protein
MMDIQIPDWCLNDILFLDVLISKNISYKDGNDIHTDKLESLGSMEAQFDDDVEYDGLKLINKKSKVKVNGFASGYNYTSYTPPVIKNICSLCGEDKPEVDRKKNLGMCDECNNKQNRDKTDFAYMNNFRLKRKSTYSNLEFKKLLK